MKKRLISVVLCLLMVVSVIPFASAAEVSVAEQGDKLVSDWFVDSTGTYQYILENGKATLLKCYQDFQKVKELVIPAAVDGFPVEKIEAYFLNGADIEKLVLPDSVKEIGSFAFANCKKLVTVTLPKALEKIGIGSFANDSALTSIKLPESLKSIGDLAFSYCKNLVDAYIPESLKIPENLFEGSEKLLFSVKIIVQPVDTQVKAVDDTAVIAVLASGKGLTYTWYYKNANMKSFAKSSQTSAIYKIKMTESRYGRQMYCKIKDQYGVTVKTNVVKLTFATPAIKITKQPVNTSVKSVGSVATLTVAATGKDLTYTWYYKNANMKSFAKSAQTSATYKLEITKARYGRQMYCLITDKYGKTKKTDTVTLTYKK